MKRLLAILSILFFTLAAFAQTNPESDSTYTLEDIYKRLENGTEGTARPFFAPATAPAEGTGKSVNELMEAAPAKSTNAALPDQVLEGRSYWGLDSSDWGENTGSMKNLEGKDIIPSAADQLIEKGFHNGTGVVVGDSDLDPSNIKAGVTIFGVEGTVVEASGDALSNQVLTGVSFSRNDSADLIGTMPVIGTQDFAPSVVDQAIYEGYHDGTGTVAGDPALDASNIRAGVTIFGVKGNVTGDATATANCIVEGKTAWVAGLEIAGTLSDPLKRELIPAQYYIDSVLSSGYSTSGGDIIELSGNFYDPQNEIRIKFGDVLIASEDILSSGADKITFVTPAGTGSVDIELSINSSVVPYVCDTVSSSGELSYSMGLAHWNYAPPVISSVSGCPVDAGNMATECSIDGGDMVTIRGNNFGTAPNDIEVFVNGYAQESVILVTDQTELQFLLSVIPDGGENMDVTVIVNGQSVTEPYLSFAIPRLFPFGNIEISGGETIVLYGSGLPFIWETSVYFGIEGSPEYEMMYGASILDGSADSLVLTFPDGVGKNLVLKAVFQQQVFYADGYISYPEPVIVPGTLRGSPGDAGSSVFTTDANNRVRLYFDVENIEGAYGMDNLLSVSYGPPGSPLLYSCSGVRFEDLNTISFIPDHVYGDGYVFTVKCLNASSGEGTDILNFPADLPVVSSVSGCTDVGNNTTECPTRGGWDLLITGTGFTENTSISIGGEYCFINTYISPTQLSCLLPEGTGRSYVHAHGGTMGNLNDSSVYVQYSTPEITSVSGCSNLGNGTLECPLDGGVEMTVRGSNFGSEGGMVYAGGSFISEITHVSSDPHREIRFTLPEGEGTDRELYFINNRGEMSNMFYFSYAD